MITKFIKFSLFIRSQIHVFEQKFDQKDTFSWGMSESKCIHFPIINGFCSFSNFIIKTQSIEIQRKFTELICKFRRKKVNAFSHLNARYIIPRSHMRLMFSSCCFCCCYSLSLSLSTQYECNNSTCGSLVCIFVVVACCIIVIHRVLFVIPVRYMCLFNLEAKFF